MHNRKRYGGERWSTILTALLLATAPACGGNGAATDAGVDTDVVAADSAPADTRPPTDVAVDHEAAADIPADLPPPEPVSGEFAFLTYNVAGLPEGISSSHPVEYIPQISPLLNNYDLVVVQEDFVYHAELANDVEHPYHTPSLFADPDEFPLGDGLNRFSNFPMGRVYRLQWPGCSGELDCSSDCLATKGFSMARTQLAPGVSLDVYNLHEEAGGCPADAVVRQLGTQRLVEYIRTYSAGRAVIVAGDFNMRWNDPEDVPNLDSLVDDAGLTESCLALECGDERIDKVFYRSSDSVLLEPLTWAVPPEFVTADGEDLSDHKPVAVRFAWSGLPAADLDSGIDEEVYPETVRLLTYNTLHGLSDEDPGAQPFDRVAERVELVRNELAAGAESLVALQEIALLPAAGYPDVMATLLAGLDRETCPACHVLFAPVGGTPPVFEAGEAVGQVTLSRLPQSGAVHNRQVSDFRTVSHLRVDSALGKVDFYNVHLEGSDENEDGVAEAEAVLDFVDDTARHDHLVVVAGDFNSLPDSAAMATFLAAGFIDLAAQSGLTCAPDDNSGCTANTLPLADPGNRTSHRIDYLLLRSPDAVDFECVPRFAAPIPVAAGTLWPSDHIGLGCTLTR